MVRVIVGKETSLPTDKTLDEARDEALTNRISMPDGLFRAIVLYMEKPGIVCLTALGIVNFWSWWHNRSNLCLTPALSQISESWVT